MEIIKVIIATLFSAAILFVIAKIIGHKQVAQLEFFDYVTGITIGSIAAELATTLDKPWWKPTVSMIIFGAVTVALSIATRRFPRSRKFINGTPTIVMNNGKLYRRNMKKAKLELSEFLTISRQRFLNTTASCLFCRSAQNVRLIPRTWALFRRRNTYSPR